MSKRTEMFSRIAAAMPEDVEVQEWVAKELERAGRSAAKTQERLDMAIEVLKNHRYNEDAITAKDFAHEVNSHFPGEKWNTRTASYYLRMLVGRNIAGEADYEYGYKGPKMYVWDNYD